MRQDTERFHKLVQWAISVVIFLLAFLPRAVHPVSRPMQWYSRAVRFSDALLAKDWGGTYQRYHPGVSTMWLSGAGLKLFAARRGLSSEQLLGAAPTKPGVMSDAIAAGVIPLALVIALCIALCYYLLSRIVRRDVAFAAGLLLALDPFHIMHSKVLHVDALLATLMITSALFLLTYLRESTLPHLVGSGIFAGLAFLTKSSSYFLIPYAALVIGVHGLMSEGMTRGLGSWLRWAWSVARLVVVWGAIAGVIFAALWPAMWVEPLSALQKMGRRVLFHIGTAHYNPVFFNGEVTMEDPGPLFYLATIAWKTTLVTLPMVGAALLLAISEIRQAKRHVVLWPFAAYAVFFTAQMCLSARKELAYLLPVFPALDILAALGIGWTADVVSRIRPVRELRWLPSAAVGGVLLLQAALVLPRHPYYGTLHNRLLGGSSVARHVLPLQDQGEGLDLAGQYLNTLPRANRASAGLYRRSASIFRRNFLGLTSIINDPDANYRVYYINQVMRQLGGEAWEETWRIDRENEPLWKVAFDGVTYVWIYGRPPAEPAAGGPEYALDHRFGEHIQLKRVRISSRTLAPGDDLTVVPIWTSDGQVAGDYKVFCHLISESGELIAQRDDYPLAGVRKTPSWRSGEVIEDSYVIRLGSDLPPGKYELSLGMYAPANMERLRVYGPSGEPLPQDRLVLGPLRIRASETHDG